VPSQRLKTKQKHSTELRETRFHFEAIGTVWDIILWQELDENELVHLEESIHARIEDFDKTYSRFRSDSFVTSIAEKEGSYTLPPDAKPLLDLYRELYSVTDGKMTPFIGHLLEDAGYDANYSLKQKKLRPVPEWKNLVLDAFPEITFKEPTLLDFGAAGKGYLVDILGELIHNTKVSKFLINAGGDILHYSEPNDMIEIGLENPDQTSEVIGIASIGNQSICGSSGNRRSWEGFNHIIDPVLLKSPSHIKAVWVVAETALLADGLTTALYFTQPDRLKKLFTFEYAIINEDNSIEYSTQFPAELFIAGKEENYV
jgi:thiamine biosynthesis lipoprotein